MSIAEAQQCHHGGSDGYVCQDPGVTSPAGSDFIDRLTALHKWQADNEHNLRLWKFIQSVLDQMEESDDHDPTPFRDALELPDHSVHQLVEMAMKLEYEPAALDEFDFSNVDGIDRNGAESLESQVRDLVTGNRFLDFHRRMHEKKVAVERSAWLLVTTMVPNELLEPSSVDPATLEQTSFQAEFAGLSYRRQLELAEMLTRGLAETDSGRRFLALILHPDFVGHGFFHALPLLAPQLYQDQETVVDTEGIEDVIEPYGSYDVIVDEEVQRLHEDLVNNLVPGLIELSESDVLPNFVDTGLGTMHTIVEELFHCYRYAVDPTALQGVELEHVDSRSGFTRRVFGDETTAGLLQPLVDEIEAMGTQIESFDDMRSYTVDGQPFYEEEFVEELENNQTTDTDLLFGPVLRGTAALPDLNLATVFTKIHEIRQSPPARGIGPSFVRGARQVFGYATTSLLFLAETVLRIGVICGSIVSIATSGVTASTVTKLERFLRLSSQAGGIFHSSVKLNDLYRWMVGTDSLFQGEVPRIESGGRSATTYASAHQRGFRRLLYHGATTIMFVADLFEAAINIHHGIKYGDTRVVAASGVGAIAVAVSVFVLSGGWAIVVGAIGGILIALASIWRRPPKVERLVEWLEGTRFGPNPTEEIRWSNQQSSRFGFAGTMAGTAETMVPTVVGSTSGASRQIGRGYQLAQELALEVEDAKLYAPPAEDTSERISGVGFSVRFTAENVQTGSTFFVRFVHDGLKIGDYYVEPGSSDDVDGRPRGLLVAEPPTYMFGPVPKPENRHNGTVNSSEYPFERMIYLQTDAEWSDGDGIDDSKNVLEIQADVVIDPYDRETLRTGDEMGGFDFESLESDLLDPDVESPAGSLVSHASEELLDYVDYHNGYWEYHDDSGTNLGPEDFGPDPTEWSHDGTQILYGLPFAAEHYGITADGGWGRRRVWLEVMHVTPEAGYEMGWIVNSLHDLPGGRTDASHDEVPFPRAVRAVDLVGSEAAVPDIVPEPEFDDPDDDADDGGDADDAGDGGDGGGSLGEFDVDEFEDERENWTPVPEDAGPEGGDE